MQQVRSVMDNTNTMSTNRWIPCPETSSWTRYRIWCLAWMAHLHMLTDIQDTRYVLMPCDRETHTQHM